MTTRNSDLTKWLTFLIGILILIAGYIWNASAIANRLVVNETADKQCGAWKVKGSGNIPTLKIDDLNLDDVSIIHLDIEGYELFAIQGAENTIKKCKPLLSFEILNHNVDYGYSQQELFDYVINLGYSSSLKVGNEILFVMDTV